MNKTTKGALAAAAAGTLLLGGAGTLAYWTDSAILAGVGINSGHFKIDASACDAAPWTLDGGDTYTDQLLVPGDTLTKECGVTMDIAGEHLTHADFDADFTGFGDEGISEEVEATVTVNGGDGNNVPVSDGDVVPVQILVDWAWGDEDNESNVAPNGQGLVLDSITVVATQEHADEDNN